MRDGAEPRPGRTYMLDDYAVIQVLAVADGRVRYRARGRAWPWLRRHRAVERVAPVAALARRIRAEIDGTFFPEIALPGRHRFRHPPEEMAGLDRHLAERARHRPFTVVR